jgi:hypothetical protein
VKSFVESPVERVCKRVADWLAVSCAMPWVNVPVQLSAQAEVQGSARMQVAARLALVVRVRLLPRNNGQSDALVGTYAMLSFGSHVGPERTPRFTSPVPSRDAVAADFRPKASSERPPPWSDGGGFDFRRPVDDFPMGGRRS